MRLFIAAGLPEEANSALQKIQDAIKGSKERQFHLTYSFLGEVSETKLPKIIEAISKVEACSQETSFSQIGFFPNRKDPRVVWIGLSKAEELIKQQRLLAKALSASGFEKTKFTPHITLARIKDKKKLDGIDFSSIGIPKFSFSISGFSLFKSTLTPQGSIYETLYSKAKNI
jgi:2'-5' RNA ligase